MSGLRGPRDHPDADPSGDGHAHGTGQPDGRSEHDHEHPTGIRGLLLSVVKPHSHEAAGSVD